MAVKAYPDFLGVDEDRFRISDFGFSITPMLSFEFSVLSFQFRTSHVQRRGQDQRQSPGAATGNSNQ